MCGILGIAAVVGERPSLGERQVARLRDMMAHRGPDGCGVWRGENVVLAHRRLAVIDPSEAAAQPMVLGEDGELQPPSPGSKTRHPLPEGEGVTPRFVLVYNGELYNDAELRRELAGGDTGRKARATLRTMSDTETVLRAFERWGTDAVKRLRGMFALALHDVKLQTLTLARDPLGVKPLYYFVGLREIMFASEPGPLLRHPDAVVAPNPRMVSAYLTTIRTVLGSETLFQGVRAVRPGEMVQVDLGRGAGGPPTMRAVQYWRGPRVRACGDARGAAGRVRAVVEDSVRRQMRADVPVCTLLSGGLDSTIVTAVAKDTGGPPVPLRTYAAGAPLPCECREDDSAGDLTMARRVARELGTRHAEAHVTREVFGERWRWMVRRMGVPMSTPNEVAIFEVARRLRADGCVVTLSGEGADELFAGYDRVLDAASEFIDTCGEWSPAAAGEHELAANAWVPSGMKPVVLTESAWRAAGEDEWAREFFKNEFECAAEECGEEGIEAHLRFHRRVNLTGLLQRLDSAAMLAGVEGRTPFADAAVAETAESLGMGLKFEACEGSGGGIAAATAVRSKKVLREAFADEVPGFVMRRAKASFPLPFERWVEDHGDVLRGSGFIREVFSEAAITAVAREPGRLWRVAWPMVNLAYWGAAMRW
jgi:asparagine synthase (glutamine-hydrolysing)